MIGTKGEIPGRSLLPWDIVIFIIYLHPICVHPSIDASLQGNILLEGIDRTYMEIIEEIVNQYVSENGIH